MPEENNTPAEGTEEQGSQGSESQDSQEESKNEEGENAESEEGSKSEKKDNAEKKVEADDEEIPIRKTRIDYILERKEKRLEKIKQDRLAKLESELHEHGEGDDEDDDLSDIEDEGEKKIVNTMKKYFGETVEKLSSKEVESEVNAFIEKDGRFAPFKDKIMKWAKHPAYAKLPMDRLAYAVVGPKIGEILSQKKQELEDEAEKSRMGGSGRRTVTKKGVWEMTPQEFEAHLHRIQTKGAQ
jgi:hypothetical protein